VATVAAAAFALYDLGDKSLWYDETFTIGTVDRPLGDALWRISHWELNQSPFYLLTLGWHRLGDGEVFLRLPAAAFTVATVPLVFVLGRRLLDPWAGAIAAAVFAGHGLVVEWSQQVRGYSMATFLIVVATLLLLRAVDRPSSTGRIVAYSLVAAVAAYAHLLNVLVIAAHGLWLLAARPVPVRVLRIAVPTLAVLGAPLAVHVLTRQGDPLYWVGEPTGRNVAGELADVAGGGVRHLVVLGGLAVLGALAVWRRTVLPVLWLAVPVLVVLASTFTVKPLLVSRFLIMVVPALAFLVAAGVRRLPPIGAGVAVAALALVSAAGVRDWHDTPERENWRDAVAYQASARLPDDDVITQPSTAAFAVRYYDPDVDILRQAELESAGERLWVFERLNEDGSPPGRSPLFNLFLGENYRIAEERGFTHVRVFLFERR
jgi:mannosyltransferase